MPRKPLSERPMTDAECQARYRAAHAAARPMIRTRRPADHRSRARRWQDTVAELVRLQAEYDAWLGALPETLADTVTAEALRAICELDLGELQAVEPPGGSGATELSWGTSVRLPATLRRPGGIAPARLSLLTA